MVEDSVASLRNLMFITMSSCITLVHTVDWTRLAVESIAADICMTPTVRDRCLHERDGSKPFKHPALDHDLSWDHPEMVRALKNID